MSLLKKSKTQPKCSVICKLVKWLVALVLFLVSIAALVGVYQTHVFTDHVEFGSGPGSFAIIAFTIALVAWTKQMKACMGGDCDVCC